MSAVRADVVALLLDVHDMFAYPALVRESTRLPLTPDEVVLAGSATPEEFAARHDYLLRELAWREEAVAGHRRAVELFRKYGAEDTPLDSLDPVMARMTPEERAEVYEVYERFWNPGGAV